MEMPCEIAVPKILENFQVKLRYRVHLQNNFSE